MLEQEKGFPLSQEKLFCNLQQNTVFMELSVGYELSVKLGKS